MACVEATDGADVLRGHSLGGGGDDIMYIVSGPPQGDCPNYSTNFLSGGAGDDLLYGSDEDDLFYGGSGRNKVVAGAGDDYIYLSWSLGDELVGDDVAGGDVTQPPDDFNEIDGGPGRDTLYVTIERSFDTVVDLTRHTLRDIEVVSGTNPVRLSPAFFNGLVSTTVNRFVLSEGGQVDLSHIDFATFNPTIEMSSYSTTLTLPVDPINSGLYFSKFIIIASPESDTIVGGSSLQVEAGGGDDSITVQYSDLMDYDATFSGSFIFGGDGHDQIISSSGSDNLAGDGGNDVIFGEGGNDVISGGLGLDRLFGGDGNDSIHDDPIDPEGGEIGGIIDGGDGIDSLSLHSSVTVVRISVDDEEVIGLPADGRRSIPLDPMKRYLVDVVSADGSRGSVSVSNVETLSAVFGDSAGLPMIFPLLVQADTPFTLDEEGIAFASGHINIGRVDGIPVQIHATGADVTYDEDEVRVTDGMFYASLGGLQDALFSGSIIIDVDTQHGTITETGGGAFKLAGMEVVFHSLAIDQDHTNYHVSFELPDLLGSQKIDTRNLSSPLVISDTGVSASFSYFADAAIALGPIRAAAGARLEMSYHSADDFLEARGSFLLSHFVPGHLPDARLAGESYVRIRNGEVARLEGAISVPYLELGDWQLVDVTLSQTGSGVAATGKISVPNFYEVDAELDLSSDAEGLQLDKIRVEASDTQIVSSPERAISIDSLSIELQPQVGAASVGASGSYLSAGADGGSTGASAAAASFELNVSGNLFSPLLTGNASVEWGQVEFRSFGFEIFSGALAESTGAGVFNVLSQRLTSVGGTHRLVGDVAVWTGQVQLSERGDFVALGTVDVANIPLLTPVFGGVPLDRAAFVGTITNNGSAADDHISFFIQLQNLNPIGIRFGLDGTIRLLGGQRLPDGSSAAGNELNVDSSSSAFSAQGVTSGSSYVLLTSSWQNPSADAQLMVTLPDGQQIGEADFSSYGIELLPQLSSSTARTAVVLAPLEGVYSVSVASSTSLGAIENASYESTALPVLEFDAPQRLDDGDISLTYAAADPDSAADISFWYTDDRSEGGVLIDSAIEADGAGVIMWDTAAVRDGLYHVYALLDDGINVPQVIWTAAPIAVGEQPSGDFRLTLTSGFSGAIGGTGFVIGTRAAETLVVENRAGLLQFDASFNAGGDRISLSGLAADYVVRQTGSSLLLSDGDTTVRLPVGPGTTDLIFDDGVRGLRIDPTGGNILVGDQAVTTSDQQLLAAAGDLSTIAPASPGATARLTLIGDANPTAGGDVDVIGSSVEQRVTVADQPGEIRFDASFNTGGDTIVLPGSTFEFLVSRAGSTAVLTLGNIRTIIPTGTAGTAVEFADGSLNLRIDPVAGQIKLGEQVLTSQPEPIAVGTDNIFEPMGARPAASTLTTAAFDFLPASTTLATSELNLF